MLADLSMQGYYGLLPGREIGPSGNQTHIEKELLPGQSKNKIGFDSPLNGLPNNEFPGHLLSRLLQFWMRLDEEKGPTLPEKRAFLIQNGKFKA